MIIGLGTDIVNIEQIAKTLQKFDEHFLTRIFTAEELEAIAACGDGGNKKACKAAKLFAAKEAAVKALGTGFNEGISWQEISVGHDALGKPLLHLTGKAGNRAELLAEGRNYRCAVSLSDDFPFAQAVVIIEIL